MLDTLRRLAVYGLMSTLFMLMLVTLSESQDHDRLLAACMIIVALINAAVIAVHLWACGLEVKRWMLWSAGKAPGDKLTWFDVMQVSVTYAHGGRCLVWVRSCGCGVKHVWLLWSAGTRPGGGDADMWTCGKEKCGSKLAVTWSSLTVSLGYSAVCQASPPLCWMLLPYRLCLKAGGRCHSS